MARVKTFVYLDRGDMLVANAKDGTLAVNGQLTILLPSIPAQRVAVCDDLLSEINRLRTAALSEAARIAHPTLPTAPIRVATTD